MNTNIQNDVDKIKEFILDKPVDDEEIDEMLKTFYSRQKIPSHMWWMNPDPKLFTQPTTSTKKLVRKYMKENRKTADETIKIFEAKKERVDNSTADYFYISIWTSHNKTNGYPDLTRHYHATFTVRFIDADGYVFYIDFSHVEGYIDIEMSKNYPYRVRPDISTHNNTYFGYDYGTSGGIVCQGETNELTPSNYIYNAIRMWWNMDVKLKRKRFPGSCTGLSETLGYISNMLTFPRLCYSLYHDSSQFARSRYPLKLDDEELEYADEFIQERGGRDRRAPRRYVPPSFNFVKKTRKRSSVNKSRKRRSLNKTRKRSSVKKSRKRSSVKKSRNIKSVKKSRKRHSAKKPMKRSSVKKSRKRRHTQGRRCVCDKCV